MNWHKAIECDIIQKNNRGHETRSRYDNYNDSMNKLSQQCV